ncbi:4'-phosphopantetheinyl transferase Npt [Pseudoalteromonas sp. P1-9]|uniref:4'-phosphopantetheinyl transferase family protein n=1 Tax=Pseudoalteromonas sp. P1-9 TaxID=1710354 RepID=UPI0006D5E68A|nr:4'-phosphopantetheinyl transferase superfamily protein [Pseudoalteromonas sp. P1-9]KPV93644.1 4'-phosphopantetheinyl transferase Npt [Pseudoalteromonas sp. P1-9]
MNPSILSNFIKQEKNINHLFENILSDKVKVSICEYDITAYNPNLFESFSIDKPECIARSVAKRQAEFLSGRVMAQQALSQLGKKDISVTIGKNRSPVWPNDILGSISHTDTKAICIVGYKSLNSYIGCDIENYVKNKMKFEVFAQIINQDEKKLIEHSHLEKNIAAILTFSAKESLFKALYPEVKRYFDFTAAQLIDIDPKKQLFRIKIIESLASTLPKGKVFIGSYYLSKTHIATFIIQ